MDPLFSRPLDQVWTPGDRERERLKEACRNFEGLFLADLWKAMMKSARALGDGSKRPFAILEDTAVEMSCEALTEGEGVGLWKILYSQLEAGLPPEDGGQDE
jgi:flagellar protein FlgJ